MKKTKKFRLKKLIALMLVIAIAGMAFMTSCGSNVKSGAPVMKATQGGTTLNISSNIFSYYLSYAKTYDLYELNMVYQSYGMEGISDTPELWQSAYPENDLGITTYGDLVVLKAIAQLERLFATELYCEDNNISLTKDDLNDIDVMIKNMIRDQHNNSKMDFNMTLSRFGVNEQIYKEIKKLEKLNSVFNNYLLSTDGGLKPISDKAIWDKFVDDYVKIKHILIRLDTGEYDEEGNIIPYSEEELAERTAKAEDIYNKIAAGEEVEDFYEDSEDQGKESYPNGYCFTYNSMVKEFEEAAFDMKAGEVRMVQTDYGMHIMKKYELTVDDILEHESTIIRGLEDAIIVEELQPYANKIEILYEEIKEFNTVTADTMLDCSHILQY